MLGIYSVIRNLTIVLYFSWFDLCCSECFEEEGEEEEKEEKEEKRRITITTKPIQGTV